VLDFRQNIENRPLAFSPGGHHHTAETRRGRGDLKGELGFRHAHKDVVGRRGIPAGLIQGGIGRRIHDAEDHALILGWCQLLG
jgi:hypothetical protein